MKLVENLRIRGKLVLMLLFPLLAVLYFSVSGGWEKWRQAQEMGSLLTLSELAVKASSLVHESQKERGMTALFLGSKGTKFQADLSVQRAETDKQATALKGYLRGFDRTYFGGEFGKSLDGALGRLEKTAATREAVNGMNIAALAAISHYTDLNAALLQVISRATHLSEQGELTRRLAAYINFLQTKEGTGIERALLSNTFAQDAFAPGMYERVLAVVTARDTYATTFESLASDADRGFARQTITGPAVEEVARMRKVAFEKAATGNFGTDPAYWFKAMTEQINLMKRVEDRLSEGLVAHGRRLEDQAWAALGIFLGVGAVAIAVASIVAYTVVRSITKSLADMLATMRELAQGDLTRRVAIIGRDELGEVAAAINTLTDSLRDVIVQIRHAAREAGHAAQQLAGASEHLSSGAQEQASALEETAASLEEITGTVRQNADNARQANQLAVGSRDVAEKGGQVVVDAVQSMSEINRSSKRIADVIATIDEIAFQTNLLALNAAVEAARAGEQGRGFAVVASEVRNLAQRSATAAKEIKGLIQDSVQKVELGSELVNRSGETLREILASVRHVTDIIGEITVASQEQSTTVEQVNKAVIQMDQVTQANAAQTEELYSTAQSLAGQAEQLQGLIARFKLDDGSAVREVLGHAAARPAPKVVTKGLGKSVAVEAKAEPALVGAHAGSRAARATDAFEEF